MSTTVTMLDSALDYASRDWAIIPVRRPRPDGTCSCKDGAACEVPGKHPHITEWPDKATSDPATIRRWWAQWPDANIGLVGREKAILDVDPRSGGDDSLAELVAKYGPLPDTPTTISGGGGAGYIFASPVAVKNSANEIAPGLDIRGERGMLLLPPSLHRSGRRYQWEVSSHPDDVPIAPAPDWLLALIQRSQGGGKANGEARRHSPDEHIREGQRNSVLFKQGCAMRRHGASEAAILAALLEDNAERCAPPLSRAEIEKIAASCMRYDPVEGEPGFSMNGHAPETHATPPGDVGPVHLTDVGNGRRLVARHGRDILYCKRLKGFLIWDGNRYDYDETGEIERRAKDTVRGMYAAAEAIADEDARKEHIKWALRSEGGQRIREMVEAAKSEPGVAVAPTSFDRDPWLLNVQNGTIDLRTGTLRQADRADRLTKLAPVIHDPSATCPTWLAFLNRVMNGRQETIDFLQRAVGYSLTGNVSEHCLFLLFGTGRNGKSTFIETLAAALGDYAMTTSTDTLLVQRAGGIPNDLARLVGARLVSASESEAGRNLAEALVKQLTGGDTISARFLHAEFFDFRPAFKLWFRTNHKPVIKGSDEGIWSRIKLVPFTQRIADNEMDKHLPERLQGELPGILNWAISGCLTWQRDGLGTAADVSKATADYRAEMDVLATFLADCCTVGSEYRCTAKELYVAYSRWAEDSGERVASQKAFGLRLAERGFVTARGTGGTRIWAGLRVSDAS